MGMNRSCDWTWCSVEEVDLVDVGGSLFVVEVGDFLGISQVNQEGKLAVDRGKKWKRKSFSNWSI